MPGCQPGVCIEEGGSAEAVEPIRRQTAESVVIGSTATPAGDQLETTLFRIELQLEFVVSELRDRRAQFFHRFSRTDQLHAILGQDQLATGGRHDNPVVGQIAAPDRIREILLFGKTRHYGPRKLELRIS